MNACLRGHRTDNGDLVGDLSHVGHVTTQLHVAVGADRIFSAFGIACFRIPSINVAHPTCHVEIDHGFGFTAFASRCCFSSCH